MQDPEVILKILRNCQMAKAVFNQAEKMGLYQDRFLKKAGNVYLNAGLKKNLNAFLSQWLKKLPNELEEWW